MCACRVRVASLSRQLQWSYPTAHAAQRWRYLNSGAYAGPAAAVRRLLGDGVLADHADDQLHYTLQYVAALGGAADDVASRYRLDTRCALFQNLWDSVDAVTVSATQRRVFNAVTRQAPCFVHGNGPKHDYWRMAKMLQFAPENATIGG